MQVPDLLFWNRRTGKRTYREGRPIGKRTYRELDLSGRRTNREAPIGRALDFRKCAQRGIEPRAKMGEANPSVPPRAGPRRRAFRWV